MIIPYGYRTVPICILIFADWLCFLVSGMSDHKSQWRPVNVSESRTSKNRILSDDEDVFAKSRSLKMSRKYQLGLSCSDAEIDYRRGGSFREGKGNFAWHN